MTANRKRFYTLKEYIALLKESEEKYEYWDGEIFLMGGASPEHVIITGNVFGELRTQLKGRNCQAFTSDLRIKVPSALPFRYADVSVACGNLRYEEIEGLKVLVNPMLLIEVLSNSTEKFDKTTKFNLYQSITSFREYLLIAQNEVSIIQYVKQTDGTWQPKEVTELTDSIYLPSVDCTLQLSDIYAGVLG